MTQGVRRGSSFETPELYQGGGLSALHSGGADGGFSDQGSARRTAGEDIDSQNRSLGFSHITFKISTHDTGGDFFLFEHSNLLPGGSPVHLHHNQEEWFYVMEGEVRSNRGIRWSHLAKSRTLSRRPAARRWSGMRSLVRH